MKKIGLLSDTHGHFDDQLKRLLTGCDEIWHAGDFGTLAVADALAMLAPVIRGVYGNVDDQQIRLRFPKVLRFTCEGAEVLMTHIGGYPGKYHPDIRSEIKARPPDLFISGHSHILKVMPDPAYPGLLHLNPGAAGRHGFHRIRTMLTFELAEGKVQQLRAIELGKRA